MAKDFDHSKDSGITKYISLSPRDDLDLSKPNKENNVPAKGEQESKTINKTEERVDLSIYKEKLDAVFEDEKLRNIAITGTYGTGKSSILETYIKNLKSANIKMKSKKFIHISLAHFTHDSDKDELNSLDTGKKIKVDERTLEGKIINQLFHQIKTRRIPFSSFKSKNTTPEKTFLFIFMILGWAFVFNRERLSNFANDFIPVGILNLFCCVYLNYFNFFFLCILIVITLYVTYNVITRTSWRFRTIRAKLGGVEAEMFSENHEASYFDKYLHEVLYLFERCGSHNIIFEDIDRYDTITIFERLREINTLVNSRRKERRFFRQPVMRFFYLTRDDIFSDSSDRTKFFDLIIPVVPVINTATSIDMFVKYFKMLNFDIINSSFENESDNKDDKKIDSGEVNVNTLSVEDAPSYEFLWSLSLFIDDLRILKNICNEFYDYYHVNKSTMVEFSCDTLLAIITYKNVLPKDFSDLSLQKGYVFQIVGGTEVGDRNRNRLSEIRNTDPELVEEFFKNISYKSISGEQIDNFINIKDGKYFKLIKFLLLDKHINEEYDKYITCLALGIKSFAINDKTFLMNVRSHVMTHWDYKLINSKLVANHITKENFNRIVVLNFHLFLYLLKKSDNHRNEEKLTIMLQLINPTATRIKIHDKIKKATVKKVCFV